MMQELHRTCDFGTGKRWGSAPTETGMSRLSLSSTDKQVRDWLIETAKGLGSNVTIDAIGNIFAVRPGRLDGPATFAGSHLDTQPTGGRYDGILGVIAGVEILRVLEENSVETEFPVGVVNWTNEEGARFPISMMGSAVWAGAVPLEDAYNLREVGGGTAKLKSELERTGHLGKTPPSYRDVPMGAHFELHIEQGPVLEAEQKKIGVVHGGRDAHTGTTPLSRRADALLLASKFILHSHRPASRYSALVSTGVLTLLPGSTNTIPGHVRFSLDIRSPDDSVVETIEEQLKQDFGALAAGEDIGGLHAGGTPGLNDKFEVAWRTDSQTAATRFHKDCIQTVREAAVEVLGGAESLVRDMASGAGHDSVYASKHCPTSMIFVPCREGISHNPTEYASAEDCELGAQVLLQSVMRYDALRRARR
ncbi:hypothetical protein B0J12DRAFT_700877 [Macrophomina phaseolina]|uniref:Peptidase M20 n=1 Tax=Macrophomina phaseolina TaxID=35725 RepID=A0ABQ8G753_9PEZI|nr:hypothetical protein B0J12DRAFT_700877 [Macrophomina phaseolina]